MSWWLKESFILKMISLLVALILWILVLSGRNYQASKMLTLRLQPPQSLVVSNSVPFSVRFHFKGPKVIVRGLEKRLDTVPVDLTNYEAGEHRIPFHEEMLGKLPVGVHVTNIEPSSIHIRLEEVHERVLSVTPQIVGEPAPGYIVEGVEIQPEKIVIQGAGSRLKTLTTVRTEPIRVDGLKETTDLKSQVVYEFRSGILREDRPPVTVRVKIKERVTTRLFAHIPIQVKGDMGVGKMSFFPAEIEVQLEGPHSLIKDFDPGKIKATATVTEAGRRARSSLLPIEIELTGAGTPDTAGIRVVHFEPKVVRLNMAQRQQQPTEPKPVE